ncbi:MAG: FHA domain-containing protein [Acidiferrobacterales bacterium]
MAKLIIKFEDVIIDQLILKQGDMSIGRRPGSDILLDNLAVSANHSTLFTIGEDTFIQDLNSTNGTFVNNRKIAKHHLVNGDMVVIGKHTLIYVNENAAKPADNLAKTVIITPPRPEEIRGTEAPAAAGARPVAAAAPKDSRQGSLFVLSGTNNGKRIDLTKAVTNLGRAGKMAGIISRNASGGYTILPGTESEKPKLNGVKVGPRGEELKHGDIIELAGMRMQFNLK